MQGGIDMNFVGVGLALAGIIALATPAHARSCKAATSCREAVEMWCNGYSGADRDNDGIPCENVCRTKAQVDRIKSEIGCEL